MIAIFEMDVKEILEGRNHGCMIGASDREKGSVVEDRDQ